MIRNKTLQELENDYWKKPKVFPTPLIENVFLLRKKQLVDFDANDIRLLLSQDIGLSYLIPMAIEVLKKNILVEALYYPGDLLITTLKVKDSFWKINDFLRHEIMGLIINAKMLVKKSEHINEKIKKEITDAIQIFERCHNAS